MPEIHLPPNIEHLAAHRAKLQALAAAAMQDPDILGMTIKGSFALDIADEFSDLDLSFVIRDDVFEDAFRRQRQLPSAPASPVAAFTAEHVGLPELLIVLYDDLVHADFRYVPLSEFPDQEEDLPCRVVWERNDLLSEHLATAPRSSPHMDAAWIEARMWTWVWYTQTKILRGEVYEALDALQFLRSRVLFSLLAVTRGLRPGGSRRAEELVGDLKEEFAVTVASADRYSTMQALEKTVDLYMRLADPLLQQQGIPKADKARGVVLKALRAGLDFKP
jgi:hypothetical protein